MATVFANVKALLQANGCVRTDAKVNALVVYASETFLTYVITNKPFDVKDVNNISKEDVNNYYELDETGKTPMLKLKVPPSTSGVFDRVKELKNDDKYANRYETTIWIERNDEYEAWVTKVDENTITYSSAKFVHGAIDSKTIPDQTLYKDAVNRDYYELVEIKDRTFLLKLKPSTAGGGKTRAPGKRVISGRARVVYVGPRGGEYIKKDGKFVRI
jgi:hypothetical protein